MKRAIGHIAVLAAILALSILPSGRLIQRIDAQSATPLALKCGPATTTVGKGAEMDASRGVRTYRHFHELPGRLTIASIVCFEPNPGADPIPGSDATPTTVDQFGYTALFVVEGSLSLKLIDTCVPYTCDEDAIHDGFLEVGPAPTSGGAPTWSTVAKGDPAVTLHPGDQAIVYNSVIEVVPGSEMTIVAASGYRDAQGPGGCPGQCWQFP